MAAVLQLEAPLVERCEQRGAELECGLLERCRQRDPAAIRAFVECYQRLVFAYLSRMLGPGPHIEDLAQEVFIRATAALHRFDPKGPARVSTWLLTIASRLASDARRKERVRQVVASSNPEPADPTNPEREHARRELGAALVQAGAQLAHEQREVFVLAELHGLSTAEIAVVVGAPEATVRTRLFRARERLRTLLRHLEEG